MSSIAKCAHCGREVGDPGPDSGGRALCPFCGQPFHASVADSVATAEIPLAASSAPIPATPAIPVAVARLGGGPPNEVAAPPVARVAPADSVAAPIVARVVPPTAAPVVARVVAPAAVAPVVARVVAPVLPPASSASEMPNGQAAADLASGEAVTGQPDLPAAQQPAQQPVADPPGAVDQAGGPALTGEYQRAMDELNVAADVLGAHSASASAIGESAFSGALGFESMPYPSETPSIADSLGQQVSPPEPTPEEIAQAQAAELARAEEAENVRIAENARIQEAMKPFALTTASVIERADEALLSAGLEPVEENREIAMEAIEEPAAGVELAVDRAEMSAEDTTETFTESAEVLAEEPIGDAAEAVVSFATEEPGDVLPEPLGQFQGVVAAEVAVPVPVSQWGAVAAAPGDTLSAGETGAFGFAPSPVGAAGQLAPAPRAEGVAPRAPARRPRRRSQGGGIVGIVGVMLSGLLGMTLVYYAFNWLGGPRYDFLKFPLPGLRHTYKHLNKYPSLPRFGIDPDAPVGTPKNGAPAEAGNGPKKKAAARQTLEPAEDTEPAQEAEAAKKTEENNEAAKKAPAPKKTAQSAKSKGGPAKGGPAKKPAQSDPLFDMPTPDFSPAAPAEKKAAPPAKPKGDAAKPKGEPAKPKGPPAKKAADDDAPFDMPAPDPADSLKMPNLTPPGST